MAKDKKILKKTIKKTSDRDCCEFMISLVIVLSILLLCFCGKSIFNYWYSPSSPKYQYGDCLINRKFELVILRGIYHSPYDHYLIAQSKVIENLSSWELQIDWDKDPYNTEIQYVDQYYIKIPCESLLKGS